MDWVIFTVVRCFEWPLRKMVRKAGGKAVVPVFIIISSLTYWFNYLAADCFSFYIDKRGLPSLLFFSRPMDKLPLNGASQRGLGRVSKADP